MSRSTSSSARRPTAGRLAITVFAMLAIGPAPATAEGTVTRLDESGLRSRAREVAIGGRLRIEQVSLPGDESVDLELTRFRVWKGKARVVVHSGDRRRVLAPRGPAFFRGTVAGDSESFAYVAVSDSGLRGLVTTASGRFEIGRESEGGPPRVLAADRPDDQGAPLGGAFCGAGRLPDLPVPPPGRPAPPEGSVTGARGQHAVDIAIDTDWEFFDLFGSVEGATDYASMLIGAASAIYQRDLSAHLLISRLILWTTPDDPWTESSDLFAALYELGDYWHANHPDVERTTVHLLSGKTGLLGGIAYGGVLCSPDIFTQGHWAGGYGLSGALTLFGAFRDTFIVSHELGHNFDSRHTHCYNGIPEPGDPPIDMCYSGDMTGGRPCYEGPTGLPADGGSIMSYCHLQPGGYGNINLWLGRQGSFGTRSERVPQQMLAHVRSVSCLPAVPGGLFADGFESGDTSAWSGP